MKISDINALESESGVIATLIHHPEFSFYSENLLPEYFTNRDNQILYNALCELAKKECVDVNAYMISQAITANQDDQIPVEKLNDLIDMSDTLSRDAVDDYKLLVRNVVDASFRRDMCRKLKECARMCANRKEKDLQQRISASVDEVIFSYSSMDELPEFKDVIDSIWDEIESEQSGLPFIFPTLNEYVKVEKRELTVFGGGAKCGKSILMLNQAVDLLKKGQSVLYIDSELSDKMFLCRLASKLSGVEFIKIRDRKYDAKERETIRACLEDFKKYKFAHVYMPIFSKQAIYTATKQIMHRFGGLDVLMVDYLKPTGTTNDAFGVYNELGVLTDLIKNEICGKMGIAGIAAAQLNEKGYLADSAKISRNASTIVYLTKKTQGEYEVDGNVKSAGSRKLFVAFNRNGPQHTEGEWINVDFCGDQCSVQESKVIHKLEEPY